MNNIKLLIDCVWRMFNVRLSFSPFSFTIFQAFLGMAVITIIVFFLKKIFD